MPDGPAGMTREQAQRAARLETGISACAARQPRGSDGCAAIRVARSYNVISIPSAAARTLG